MFAILLSMTNISSEVHCVMLVHQDLLIYVDSLVSCVLNSLKVKFPYLVQRKLKAGQEVRRVAQLDWQIIENDCKCPFVASGLEIVPLPVNLLNFSHLLLERVNITYICIFSNLGF